MYQGLGDLFMYETGGGGGRSFGPVSEFLDPVFAQTSRKRSLSVLWACFRKNWVYKFLHWCPTKELMIEIDQPLTSSKNNF